jgi:hypothetical protein
MTLDLKNKCTYNYVDIDDMVMEANYIDNGETDSIGRTFEGYFAWEYEGFIDGVKKCFVWETDINDENYIQGYRHPNRLNDTYNYMSRDHILYGLIFMKYINDDELNSLFVDFLEMRKKIKKPVDIYQIIIFIKEDMIATNLLNLSSL